VLTKENIKADKANGKQIGAPLQGKLSQLLIEGGDEVKRNQPLFVIEAMKMETTITANDEGKVKEIILLPGCMVKADDLVLVMEDLTLGPSPAKLREGSQTPIT
jgi:pyruvate carboxylase